MRKSALLSVCVAALAITMAATPTLGGVIVFLSEVSTIGGGAVLANPNINAVVGVPFTLGLWVSSVDDTADPNNAVKINGMALDLDETNLAGLLSATGIELMESGNIGTFARWEGATDGNMNLTATSLFSGSNTVGVENMGLTANFISRTFFDGNWDENADGGNGAFLFAILEILPTAVGNTDLFLKVGKRKIGYSPVGDTTIGFGAGDAPVDRTIEGAISSLADASVTVVPEPATMGLLAVGAFALIARRRRR